MKNKNIIIIRKRLDKLDLSMLSIIKKRNLLVDKILKQKKYKNQIIDKQRIKIILNKIKKDSKKRKEKDLFRKRNKRYWKLVKI